MATATRTRSGGAAGGTTKKPAAKKASTATKAKAASTKKASAPAPAPAAPAPSVYDRPAQTQPAGGAENFLALLLVIGLVGSAMTLHHFFGPDKQKEAGRSKPAAVKVVQVQPRKSVLVGSVAECEARNKRFSNMPPADCGGAQ